VVWAPGASMVRMHSRSRLCVQHPLTPLRALGRPLSSVDTGRLKGLAIAPIAPRQLRVSHEDCLFTRTNPNRSTAPSYSNAAAYRTNQHPPAPLS
jgi:hypothetical protein